MIAAIFVLDAKRRTSGQKNQARRPREEPRRHNEAPVAIVEVAREEKQHGKRDKQRGVHNDLPVHGF